MTAGWDEKVEDGRVLFQFFNFCEKSAIFQIITDSCEFEKKLKAFQLFQHSEIMEDNYHAWKKTVYSHHGNNRSGNRAVYPERLHRVWC